MKKAVLLLIINIVVLSLAACMEEPGHSTDKPDILFESGIFTDKEYYFQLNTVEEDVIPDQETAIAVATAIFDRAYRELAGKGYIPQAVFYDEEDEFWVVSFFPDDDPDAGEMRLGGDICIALQKKDGKVIKMWMCS